MHLRPKTTLQLQKQSSYMGPRTSQVRLRYQNDPLKKGSAKRQDLSHKIVRKGIGPACLEVVIYNEKKPEPTESQGLFLDLLGN